MNLNKFISNSNPEPENLMQAILDNAAEGIVLIRNDHTVLLFNTAIKDALKSYFTKELEVGDDYRDFVVEESMQLYLESFEKAINGTSILLNMKLETQMSLSGFYIQLTLYMIGKRSLSVLP
jgi:PAS domain-containing protein